MPANSVWFTYNMLSDELLNSYSCLDIFSIKSLASNNKSDFSCSLRAVPMCLTITLFLFSILYTCTETEFVVYFISLILYILRPLGQQIMKK